MTQLALTAPFRLLLPCPSPWECYRWLCPLVCACVSSNAPCCSSPSWWRVTELNSSKGSAISPPGVSSPLSKGTPFILFALTPKPLFGPVVLLPRSTDCDSFTLRKLMVSIPRPWLGIIGGFEWRRRAHEVLRKKGWPFTSEAPARDPNRRDSSLMSSFRINDLQRLNTLVSKPPRPNRLGRPTWKYLGHLSLLETALHRARYWQTSHSGSYP